VTPTEFACICDIAKKMWGTTLRGGLTDFAEYQSRVLEATLANDGQTIGSLCRSAMRDMRRERDKDAEIVAHLSFEAQRPQTADVLPATFEVPFKRWGGARVGAGRKPKKKAA
jgi:hypothetical protein